MGIFTFAPAMRYLPLLFVLLLSCRSDKKMPESEGNLDAARNFIRAALDGKFDDARRFMIRDSLNMNFMDLVERTYKNLDQVTRDNYRTASIRILEKMNLNDSTGIVIYANSFRNDPDTLKVMRIGQEWLVDFKYLYQHHLDTTGFPRKDSLR